MNVEYFSGDCNKACDVNAPPDIRSACDEGSYQYCSTEANITKPECIDFIKRVEDTITDPNKAGLTKVIPYNQKTLLDYQKGLSDISNAFCLKETNLNSEYCTKTYPSSFKNADYTSRMDNLFSGLMKIGANPKTTDKKFYLGGIDDKKSAVGIDAISGFLKWKGDKIKAAYDKYTKVVKDKNDQTFIVPKEDNKRELIFGFFADPEFKDFVTLYPSEFNRIEKAVIIERRMLDDMGLIMAMNASDTVTEKVYTFISNELASNKRAEDMDITLGLIQAFIKNAEDSTRGLNEARRKDPDFTELKKVFDTLSLLQKGGICEKNPLDPKCIELGKIGTLKYKANDMAGDVKTYLKSLRRDTVCSTKDMKKNAINVFGENCKDVDFNDTDKTNIMQYCVSPDGMNDGDCKKNPPTFIDIKWLKSMTDTDFDNKGKISRVRCDGKSGRFTPDECRKICERYPDICKDDIKTKCSNDEYRYSQTKNVVDAFQNHPKESYTSRDSQETCDEFSCMYYVLIFVIFLLFVTSLRHMSARPRVRIIRIVPIDSSSVYKSLNNEKI